MQSIELNAYLRKNIKKGPNKVIRRDGFCPAVLYGPNTKPVNLKVNVHDFTSILLNSRSKENSLIKLKLDDSGETKMALIREVKYHPVTDIVQHIDFLNIADGYKTTFKIPITFVGTPIGLKFGGILTTSMYEISVKGDPLNIVDDVTVDISNLKVKESLHVSDINIENAEIVEKKDLPVVSVIQSRVTEADSDEEENNEE